MKNPSELLPLKVILLLYSLVILLTSDHSVGLIFQEKLIKKCSGPHISTGTSNTK